MLFLIYIIYITLLFIELIILVIYIHFLSNKINIFTQNNLKIVNDTDLCYFIHRFIDFLKQFMASSQSFFFEDAFLLKICRKFFFFF